MRTAVVHIKIERTLQTAAAAALPSLVDHMDGSVAILPSSLEHRDPVAEAIRDHLPVDSRPEIITPISGSAARRAFLIPTVLGDWRDVPINTPGVSVSSALMPKAIVTAQHRIIAVDVVEVARHGPFVLDVPARYVHPRQRLRLVADHSRSSLVAEVASALPISVSVVSLTLPGGTFLATTTDVIAAELVALALAERCIGSVRAFTGPWEDAVVQRATELELGVLMPARIRLIPEGECLREPWADALQEHVRRRLGIPGTSSLRP